MLPAASPQAQSRRYAHEHGSTHSGTRRSPARRGCRRGTGRCHTGRLGRGQRCRVDDHGRAVDSGTKPAVPGALRSARTLAEGLKRSDPCGGAVLGCSRHCCGCLHAEWRCSRDRSRGRGRCGTSQRTHRPRRHPSTRRRDVGGEDTRDDRRRAVPGQNHRGQSAASGCRPDRVRTRTCPHAWDPTQRDRNRPKDVRLVGHWASDMVTGTRRPNGYGQRRRGGSFARPAAGAGDSADGALAGRWGHLSDKRLTRWGADESAPAA